VRDNPACVDPRRLRLIILEQSKRANVGHIGSALSIADIVAALYGRVLRISDPNDPDRDRFVLSKGHASLALYGALFLKRWISRAQLDMFCHDGSLLGVHPERALTGVDFSTGSLGHGLPFGVGAAMAARLQSSSRRCFVLVSDAECNEGSVWEAAMLGAQHRLSNLIAIVDVNGQQALGYTRDILDLAPLGERWRAFGWDVHVVDGHDIEAMSSEIEQLDTTPDGRPHVLLAQTIFGRGVSFMTGQIKWHYQSMSPAEYRKARAELEHPS
jgi:transketolase